MAACTVFLQPSRLRAALRRHPWVYRGAVSRVEGDYTNGDAVVVRAPDGRFVAHALINDGSRFFLRLVSFDREARLDEELLRARVRDAVALRHDVLRLPERAQAYRLVHSEGDGLPGLVVDRYGDVLALSCTSLGIHQRLEPIVDELRRQLDPAAVLELEVGEGLREKEGLPPSRGVLWGTLPPPPLQVEVDGLLFEVPLLEGQKTGLYLDQRENARRVGELASGRRVLDACCYGGEFALAAARGGASSVEAFDSSAEAVELACRNAARNGLAERVQVKKASLYPELRTRVDQGQTFDLIVLDPPKFAPSARDLERAQKGYLDANLLALRLLAPGGLLLTFSCSHHMSEQGLEEVLRDAATRCDRELRILERRGAGADHPTCAHCPEGRYLKGLLVQRRGGS